MTADERTLREQAALERARRLWAATHQMASSVALTRALAEERASLLEGAVRRITDDMQDRVLRTRMRESEPLVSLADAARLTGRNQDLLRRWCNQGRLPGIRIGRNWALSQAAIESLGAQPRRRRRLILKEAKKD